jgi:homogentisate 1,2-dioxygenase
MNGKNLVSPHGEGIFARQAHVDLPNGSFERELGREGFFGAASHMYHRNPPTAFESISGSIKPQAFDVTKLNERTNCPLAAIEVLSNACVRMRFWRADGPMQHLVRNADGDDLLFVHRGGGEFFCDYGHLSVTEGDYVVVPRGTMWRLQPLEGTDVLMIESTGAPYSLPDRGGVGQHAPFDPGMFDKPVLDDTFKMQSRQPEWEVRVKRGNKLGRIVYRYNPLDAIGWKGDLYPVRLNVKDIRPLMSHRVHLPPSAYTTFLGNRFVVCTFVPRPLESDPKAMKLPFFHNNDDFDEVMFCHRGRIGSRGPLIGESSITLHPAGFTHGPHPEVMPFMFDAPQGRSAEGYNVMLDTLDALEVGRLPAGCEIAQYSESWRKAIEYAPDAKRGPSV